MAKKRVHELAKELSLESKDLITRMEKMGITVKSHSSTLEDSDIERIKEAVLAGGSREIVEERIKSTVIRRRAVRAVKEEPPPEEVEAPTEPKEAAPEAAAGAPPKEKIQKIKEEKQPAKQPADVSAKTSAADEQKITRPKAAKGMPTKAPVKPAEKIIVASPENSLKKEIEKPRKKGRAPVEVFIEEEKVIPRRKVLEKKSEKKQRKQDDDREIVFTKWRDEKKVAPVKMKKTEITTPKAIKRRLKLGETISVSDLAKRMGVKANEVINKLIAMGVMATINQSIDYDISSLVASEFQFQVEKAEVEFDESVLRIAASSENLRQRAPVVTIMGHVDHGKTSLLDAIRQSNVIAGEAGGITQAIGAYHVNINNRDIVFLDTPGHEAFTAMRARGSRVTDIVVLVVAADDGVMGQTIEAINHSKVAGVPIIVAVNKIDKPGADPDKIKQALSEHGLISEKWGGNTIFCEVSAKKKQGIEELLEMILLQADVMELKADPDLPAHGIIIESKLDRGRGPVATVLIQEGTLKESDSFVSKTEYGRVRAMINDQGRRVKKVGPSMPVEVIGFSSVPQVGAEFFGVDDEKKARSIADYWTRKTREKELSASSKITLEQLYQKIKEGVKDFNVIIKADVRGSIEAIADALNKLSTDDIRLKIIHSSAGAISETDVMLASASNAIIIGFNIRPDAKVMEIAEQEKVDIKLYDIIYNVISDIRDAMEGLLEPEYKETVQGRAEIRELFKVPKIGTIAGCYVTDGKITRNAGIKLVRDSVVIFDGKILSLRRFKDDAREVLAGFECGIGIDGFNDLHVSDIIEAYITEKIERKL